jgi:V/A-type H+-transporting ATPase subunit D
MSVERLDVIPTRTELIRSKSRKQLAEGIAEILQKELEILLISLLEYREWATNLQKQLFSALARSYSQFIEAEMMCGCRKVKELALTATPISFNVEISKIKGVLGLQFPSMNLSKHEGRKQIHRLSLLDAPFQLEEIAVKIQSVMALVMELASLTATIREILESISVKRRQINVLYGKKIPELDATIKYIENVLEEIEHQDSIRVRVLQRKRKEKAEKLYETD